MDQRKKRNEGGRERNLLRDFKRQKPGNVKKPRVAGCRVKGKTTPLQEGKKE